MNSLAILIWWWVLGWLGVLIEIRGLASGRHHASERATAIRELPTETILLVASFIALFGPVELLLALAGVVFFWKKER